MKKGIAYFFNLLIVTALMVSTTGVTIYTHYCNSEGQITSSLFVDKATCNHHHSTLHQQDCCQADQACTNEATSDCCSDVSHHYQIENTYYTTNNALDSPEPVVLQLFDEVLFGVIADVDMMGVLFCPMRDPPPVSGKELITRILHFKIFPEPLA